MRPILTILLSLCFAASLRAEKSGPQSLKELEQVIVAVQTALPRLTKFDGSDYTLFYSAAIPPRSGAAGLYLSDSPFKPGAEDPGKAVGGRIGNLDVRWTKQVIADGSTQQEAIVPLRPHLFAHILIEARNEADLEMFVSELSRLPVFSPKETLGAKPYAGPGFFDPHLRTGQAAQANSVKQ